METKQLVLSLILFALALVAGVCSLLQFLGKGSPLNNSWLFSTPAERRCMDKKPLYRQSGIALTLVGAAFLTEGLQILLELNWLFIPVLGLALAAVVYAVVSSLRMEKKR